jgi:hypothetical protein
MSDKTGKTPTPGETRSGNATDTTQSQRVLSGDALALESTLRMQRRLQQEADKQLGRRLPTADVPAPGPASPSGARPVSGKPTPPPVPRASAPSPRASPPVPRASQAMPRASSPVPRASQPMPRANPPVPPATAQQAKSPAPSPAPAADPAKSHIKHDSRGNAVWNWAASVGAAALESTSRLLKRLEVPELSLDDKPPELEIEDRKTSGYDPYNQTKRGKG